MGPKSSVSPLLLPQQHLSKTTFTSTSTAASGCSMPKLAELVPVSPCSRPPRGPQLFHSQVNSLSSRACKCTFVFHSEVTSPLENVLANALVTFTRKSASPVKNVLAQALSTFTLKAAHSQDHA